MKGIEMFGDSVLKGVLYSAETERYSLIKREAPLGGSVFVKNNAHMGYTVEKGIISLEKRLCAIGSETVSIFNFGGNDCAYDWKKISNDPTAEHSPAVTPERFVNVYTEMLKKARSSGSRVAVCRPIPLHPQKYFNFITKGLSKENILAWLGDMQILYRWQENYADAAVKCAIEQGCDVIDIRAPFMISHRYDTLFCEDGIHPSEEGYALIERASSQYLKTCFA